MKKIISVLLCVLLTLTVVAFAACGDKEPITTDPSSEATTEFIYVKADYSGFVNFRDAVANLTYKTVINNYNTEKGYIDDLLAEGNAIKQKIKDEKLDKDTKGLAEFETAYETLTDLWDVAEKAAAKYVKGFYKVNGKKDVTAVYCYMNVKDDGQFGNSYIFALTYTDGETPVTVYMNNTVTSDAVEVDVYTADAEKFYSPTCENDISNTPVYNNITLDLDAVLSKAK